MTTSAGSSWTQWSSRSFPATIPDSPLSFQNKEIRKRDGFGPINKINFKISNSALVWFNVLALTVLMTNVIIPKLLHISGK